MYHNKHFIDCFYMSHNVSYATIDLIEDLSMAITSVSAFKQVKNEYEAYSLRQGIIETALEGES